MAIFTGIAAAIGAVTTFAAGFGAIGTFALQAAVGIGLSYASQALAGKPKPPAQEQGPGFSVSGKLQAGGTVPRSFILGRTVTAGSLVYANTWGQLDQTPNAYLTQVIALSDMPVTSMAGVFVNGGAATLISNEEHASYGIPIQEYRSDTDHLWVKFYDGTQSTADAFMVGSVSSAERPYGADRVGKGIAYAIVTALVDDKLFTGFPSFKFELQGLKLYDPTKDDTVGGSGAHRLATPATWGGDGDDLPAVQLYNLMKGITYDGEWLYGLQNLATARLPIANWMTQIDKCRALIEGPDGNEATYLSGGELSVSAQVADAFETILTTCQGKMAEIGGFYKLRVGAPDTPVMSFDDGNILSSEEQSFTPFFGLSDTITGITAKYPSPDEGWAVKAAPPLYRDDLEGLAGDRRLLADVSFDYVSRASQVQRLMKSALDSAQRARRHTFSLPPEFWLLEPLDVVEWSSERNGYASKLMEIDGLVDQANLDVLVDMTEVDPSDYDWDQDVDFTNPTNGPIVFVRPGAQAIVDWFAEGDVIYDEGGHSRRPAVRLEWDGDQPDVEGVAFEVRNDFDQVVIYRGRTDNLAAGAILISQNLLPDTDYEVRGRYIPASPRETLWSSWLDVTTPDVRLSIYEFNAGIVDRLTNAITDARRDIDRILKKQATDLGSEVARNWLDKKETRSQQSSLYERSKASIEQVRITAADADAALSQEITTISAEIEDAKAEIVETRTSFVNLNQAVAQDRVEYTARFGDITTTITEETEARSTADASLALSIQQLDAAFYTNTAYFVQQNVAFAAKDEALSASLTQATTTLNGHTSSISTLTQSYNGISAEFGVLIDIDGATGALIFRGAKKLDGSGATFDLLLRGDFTVDGSIKARHIGAGEIDAIRLSQNGVTVDKIAQNAATKVYSSTLTTPVSLPSMSGQSTGTWSTETIILDTGAFNCPVASVATIVGSILAKSGAQSINVIGSLNATGAAESFLNFKIYVDGSPVNDKNYAPNQASGFVWSGSTNVAYAPYPQDTTYSPPLVHAVALTAGDHRVQVMARWRVGAGTGARPSIENGGIAVIVSNKTTLN